MAPLARFPIQQRLDPQGKRGPGLSRGFPVLLPLGGRYPEVDADGGRIGKPGPASGTFHGLMVHAYILASQIILDKLFSACFNGFTLIKARRPKMISTHRLLQLRELIDSALAESRVCLRCAANAASINNQSARAHFLERATRLTQAAVKAQGLLST